MDKLSDILDDDIEQYRIEYRVHAVRRMFQRDIFEEDVELLLKEGKIIERYDDDFPLPSLLISGADAEGHPLHVVAGINNAEKIIVVITAYEPDPLKWSDNFTGRIQ